MASCSSSVGEESPRPQTRKDRQRLHVRRSYYRKLNYMNSMREQVKKLEEEYAQALKKQQEDKEKAKKREISSPTNAHEVPMDTNTSTTITTTIPSYAEILENYMRASQLKEQLRLENGLLKQQMAECDVLAIKMARMLKDMNEDEADDSTSSPFGYQLIHYLSVDDAHEIIRKARQQMSKFRLDSSYLTTGASVFGWRDRRKMEPGRVQFSIRKNFFDTPERIATHSWDICANPELHASLYSRRFSPSLHLIQKVDEDNQVMLRVFRNPEERAVAKSLFLMSRFPIDTGYMILFQPLAGERLMPMDEASQSDSALHVQWLDKFAWLIYEKVSGHEEYCQMDFGGTVPSTMTANSEAWMLEVLLICLRLENQIYGPMFALSSSVDND